MMLSDGYEEDNTADEETHASAASSCLNTPGFSRSHLPADGEEQSSSLVFPAAFYLLMKENQNQELTNFNLNLEPCVKKCLCMRTSSNGFRPFF